MICNSEKKDWLIAKKNADQSANLYIQYQGYADDYRAMVLKGQIALSQNLPKNPQAAQILQSINQSYLVKYDKMASRAKGEWEIWSGIAQDKFLKYAKCIEKELGIKNVDKCCCPEGEWTLKGGGGGLGFGLGLDVNSYIATCDSNRSLQAIITVYTGKIGLLASAGAGYEKGKYYCAKSVVDLLGKSYGAKFGAGAGLFGGSLSTASQSFDLDSPQSMTGQAGVSEGKIYIESVFTMSWTQLVEVKGCN